MFKLRPAGALRHGLLWLVLLAPLVALAQINRGPYLQDVRENSIIVAFEGGSFTAPVVAYGQEDPDEYSAPCSCAAVHCYCLLSDLAPDTGYLYEVRDGSDVLAGAAFLTAPDWGRPFRFVVHGDNRSDHAAHSTVIQNLMGEEFEFVMNTGDMVSSGEIETDWDDFFAIETPLIGHKPLYASVGNHEEDGGEVPIVERVFHWPYQESNSPSETYYSFNYSNCHFLVIDDFVRVKPWYECLLLGKLYDNCLAPEQINWIKIDLAKAVGNPDIDHVFVFMHEGPYSSKEGRTGSAAIRDLLPLFAQSKVKVVFSGHDHYFEHGISGNGIDYVISGGGGAPLYQLQETFLNQLYPHEVMNNKSTHSYQVVYVEGTFVAVTTYDVDEQTVIDSFEVGEKADCVVAEDCTGPAETCEGQWTCPNYACVWECAPPASCTVVEDCGAELPDSCDGAWECSLVGQCVWVCPPEAECETDADCADKTPLNDCTEGHYECMDAVCEWVCVPDVECVFAYECVGKPAPDDCVGGYFDCQENECVWTCPPGPEQPEDVSTPVAPDTASPDAASQEDGETPGQDSTPAVDSGTPATGSGAASKSSGCGAGVPGTPGPAWLLLALLAILALVRRTGFPCP